RDDDRVAFRLLRYLKDRKRLELVDEVLEPPLRDRGVDALVSTNAIHLYHDLPDTLASWTRIVRPGGRVFVQSGNIRNPQAGPGEWIIDETVEAIHERAMVIVRADARFAAYRAVLDDAAKMRQYDELRRKYFLPVRPLDDYLSALRGAGLAIGNLATEVIEARVDEWRRFLAVYHEGVLGWVGGAEKIESAAANESAVTDRLEIIGLAMQQVFGGRETFDCCWTYLTAARE
ncbi:MAG: methyltransferase domain-containing protein, partial [Chloroflexota bacterium]